MSKKRECDNYYKVERSEYAYDLVNAWIGNADNKVSVSCAIFTGAFGVISFLSGRVCSSTNVVQLWKCIYYGSFVLSLLLFMGSLLYYVLAINPNLGKSGIIKKNKPLKKKYPLFYGDINELSLTEYRNLMNKGDEQDYINELQAETHYNSGICINKMKKYRIGLWLSFASIVASLLSWVSHYLMFK